MTRKRGGVQPHFLGARLLDDLLKSFGTAGNMQPERLIRFWQRALLAAARIAGPSFPKGRTMADPVEALILDLLEWIGPNARPYREVIDAWRTSCPRLPVWEEANDRGFIEHHHGQSSEEMISVSAAGAAFLAERRCFGR
jgi:hypothetical protein